MHRAFRSFPCRYLPKVFLPQIGKTLAHSIEHHQTLKTPNSFEAEVEAGLGARTSRPHPAQCPAHRSDEMPALPGHCGPTWCKAARRGLIDLPMVPYL